MSGKADRNPLKGIDRRSFIAGAAAMGVLAALPGCSRRSADAEAASAGSVDIDDYAENEVMHVYLANPACIEPFNAYESNGIQICRMLFDPLLTYDYEIGDLLGCAASSWNASDDGRVFTFALAYDGLFSDGTPVEAEDFKYAWERICNPMTDPSNRSHLAYLLEGVKGYSSFVGQKSNGISGLTIIDRDTFSVTLDEPFYDFPYVVTHPSLAPVRKEDASNPIEFSINPLGNGAFSMAEPWVDGQYVKLIANELHRGSVPNIQMVNFTIFKDEQTAYLEFEAGNLDACAVPAADFVALQAKSTTSPDGYAASADAPLLNGDESATFYLVLDCEDPNLASPDFRRAISLAINRQNICDTVFNGAYAPATGIVPPGVKDYRENAWADCTYDKDAAAAALSDAGFPKGQNAPALTLLASSADYQEDVMGLIASDLTALGLTVTVEAETPDDFVDDVENGNFQITHSSWVMDYPLSDNILSALCSSESSFNRGSYRSPEFDDGLRAARATRDEEERTAAYATLDDRVAADMPVIPIFFYRHHHVVGDKVAEFYLSPTSIADFEHAALIG